MNLSEKPQVREHRVQHGPHRLHLSRVAVQPSIPAEELVSSDTVGEPEIVSSTVEIPLELVPFA